ncbi:SH3 domain-containing protein [Pseudaestuariivita sp.]|uniref:SH3 domain-containing protein n=1 Tax=Pseudaestuariivita sp. TaxID=2211669 RepID=UPI0040596706
MLCAVLALGVGLPAGLGAGPAQAEGLEPRAAPTKGPVTGLPMPRYVSMKASTANVRRGPSLGHRIDWVFKRQNMPLTITHEHGHWRRVADRDGAGGWVHYSLLSGVRTVIVEQDMLQLHTRPDAETPITAMLELGVVARLGKCGPDWCRLRTGGHRGWARKAALWGVAPGELRE